MGKGCQVCKNVEIFGPQNVSLGDQVILNDGVILQSCEGAAHHHRQQHQHRLWRRDTDRRIGFLASRNHEVHVSAPVVIDRRRRRIGARAIILPGVTVGEWAGVAAGSVVTQDVEPDTLVFGIPARAIRRFGKARTRTKIMRSSFNAGDKNV